MGLGKKPQLGNFFRSFNTSKNYLFLYQDFLNRIIKNVGPNHVTVCTLNYDTLLQQSIQSIARCNNFSSNFEGYFLPGINSYQKEKIKLILPHGGSSIYDQSIGIENNKWVVAPGSRLRNTNELSKGSLEWVNDFLIRGVSSKKKIY